MKASVITAETMPDYICAAACENMRDISEWKFYVRVNGLDKAVYDMEWDIEGRLVLILDPI